MTRKEFLGKIGIGAAFVLTATCMGGCKEDDGDLGGNGSNPPVTSGLDFTIDLNAAENAALQTNGGFVLKNKVVIARDNTGSILAATQVCSHEEFEDVIFQNDEFICTRHGARFSKQGAGLNNNGANGLFIYQTALNGSILRVFES